MTERVRHAVQRLAQAAYTYAPPEAWEAAEEAERTVAEFLRAHEQAVRSLEAALARERRLLEAVHLLEAALTNIQEEARRARRLGALAGRQA